MNLYQMEYKGLTIGPGTDYTVKTIEGLGSFDARLESNPRTVEHGGLAIAQYLDAKTLTLLGHVHQGLPGAKIDLLKTHFAPSASPSPLRVWLDTGVRQINVLPTRFTMTHTAGYKKGYVPWALELYAPDPKQYADAQSALILSAANPSGSADNEGNIGTYPLLIVEGGSTNPPSFTNTLTGETIAVNRNLVSGDRLVIDFGERTVKFNGVSDYANLDPASTWWDLEPGVNDILVNMSGTAQAKFFWRSAWI